MDFLVIITILFRNSLYFYLPIAISVIAVYKVLKIRRQNGGVIAKRRKISWISIPLFSGLTFLSLMLIDPDRLLYSLGITLFLFFLLAFPYLRTFVENFERGIYKNGVVYPGFTASWQEIEGVINKCPDLRLIHNERGAFDIPLEKTEFDHIWDIVVQKTNVIEGNQ